MTFPFEALTACRAELEEEAGANDAQAAFPAKGMDRLRDLGGLSASLPHTLGGQGLGTGQQGMIGLLQLLRLVGQGSLALGRIVEGHINALRLIACYGTPDQLARAAMDVHDGALFGVWVTEGATPLRMEQVGGTIRLRGEKIFASGARHVTRALVTARTRDGTTRMLLVTLDDGRDVSPVFGGLAGMRGAETGRCDFSAMMLPPDAVIGQAGDYLRQPEFSAGAWRGMAVALGGIERLASLLRLQLAERGRADSPAQQARIGQALIATETAYLWTRKAALVVATQDGRDAGDIVATVNLARIAVERAGLEVIELVQRGLGLSAFTRTNVVERLTRDLATYLRQPAPDETLCEGAAWFTHRDLPRVEDMR
ncbi:acyl-CoA dehydrogenase family protein [Novacetimonas pomaceti]|uniref:Acyl-CoA dehydrogenase n=1 Tax=Novacetimonas pomaceti TaxID=2021998 RepID=A0ABX5P9J8_9PROT|nr:acyl-CoA dehydrogenase family protein [Novacetimonas pomaceti]PYD48583.1 acyl-CoA dehydrogenase [Novacetimonas pomaceti]